MKKNIFFILCLIIGVALFLRLYQLGDVPSSPDWDEAALGYNAYSILTTGRDEYGEFLPFILRSFDDYKPALYTYFIIPLIPILDVNIISVRLPSVIFGLIAVLATFFIVRKLFSFGNIVRHEKATTIALLSSLLLAISPWHIQFSRIAFEANTAVTITLLALLSFLYSFKRPLLLSLSAFLFAINLYEYQSIRVFGPLFVLVLSIIFRKELFSIPKKYIIAAVLVGLIVATPIAFYTVTSKEGLMRARGTSAFADSTPFLEENAKRLLKDKESNDYLGLVLDNRRLLYAKTIASGYLSHFDLNWLFISGDIARHHAPYMGLLYLWELPFLLIGIYQLIFGNYPKKIKQFLFAWFLITPIPASITSGVPHAIRTLNFLPLFQIFTAIGIVVALQKISNIKYQISNIKISYIFFSTLFLFFILNFTYYLNQYFVQQNYYNSRDWQYGFKEAVETVKNIESRYNKIVVSNSTYLDQSYMFFLFYLKYPPHLYQKDAVYASGGFRQNHTYGKYEFRPIVWDKESQKQDTLYVGRPEDFPKPVHVIKTINFLNGDPNIQIVDVQP